MNFERWSVYRFYIHGADRHIHVGVHAVAALARIRLKSLGVVVLEPKTRPKAEPAMETPNPTTATESLGGVYQAVAGRSIPYTPAPRTPMHRDACKHHLRARSDR